MNRYNQIILRCFRWLMLGLALFFVCDCFFEICRRMGFFMLVNVIALIGAALILGYEAHKRLWDGSFISLAGWLREGEEITIKSVDPHMVDVGVTRLYMIVQDGDGRRIACHALDSDFTDPIRIGWRYRKNGSKLEGKKRFSRSAPRP